MHQQPARCLKCGYEWDAWPSSVAQGSGCPSCGGVAPVSRDEWDRRAAAAGIEWITGPPKGTTHRAPARCLTCGYEYEPTGMNVSNGAGCAACAQKGFDPAAPGTVYLIRHDDGPYIKVGITGPDPSRRLTSHGLNGWEVLGTWPIPVGRDAEVIERAVIAWWKQSGATRCKRDELPEGQGWTEAVHITEAADEPRTLAYIEELVAEVGGGY